MQRTPARKVEAQKVEPTDMELDALMQNNCIVPVAEYRQYLQYKQAMAESSSHPVSARQR